MQGQDVLEIGGQLTLGEMLRFQYFHCFRRTWWIVAFSTLVAVLFLLLMGAVALLTLNSLTPSSWIAPLLLLLFWAVVVTAPYRGAKRLIRTSAALSGPVTYAFRPDSIHQRGNSFSSEVDYPAIWMVRQTRTQYLIYLNSHSALVLPKRYFKDEAQQSAWRTLIEEKISPKTIEEPGFLARRF
jgi:hypothetical protein